MGSDIFRLTPAEAPPINEAYYRALNPAVASFLDQFARLEERCDRKLVSVRDARGIEADLHSLVYEMSVFIANNQSRNGCLSNRDVLGLEVLIKAKATAVLDRTKALYVDTQSQEARNEAENRAERAARASSQQPLRMSDRDSGELAPLEDYAAATEISSQSTAETPLRFVGQHQSADYQSGESAQEIEIIYPDEARSSDDVSELPEAPAHETRISQVLAELKRLDVRLKESMASGGDSSARSLDLKQSQTLRQELRRLQMSQKSNRSRKK